MAVAAKTSKRKRKSSIPMQVYRLVEDVEILLELRSPSSTTTKTDSREQANDRLRLGSHSAPSQKTSPTTADGYSFLRHNSPQEVMNDDYFYSSPPTMHVAYNDTTTTQQQQQHIETAEQDASASPSSTGASAPFMSLPAMQLIAGGRLDMVDRDTLRQAIDPIWKSIERLDAISMLDLQKVDAHNDGGVSSGGGARVSDGVFVKPIHDEVTPIRRRKGSTVRYVHISEVPGMYSVGIFIFPPHAIIPLHDHPGMVVLSRVLYGDLERTSLDLVRNKQQQEPQLQVQGTTSTTSSSSSSWFSRWSMTNNFGGNNNAPALPHGSRLAYWNGRDHLQAPDVTALYPYEGQLHEFRAGPHGAAVLDVLLPPYDEDHDRDCTFYRILPMDTNTADANDQQQQQQQGSRHPCWIVPTGQPEDFHCLSGRYCELGGDYFSDDDDV